MSNATTDMTSVLGFVLQEASGDNLDNLVEAIKSRRRILADIAAATLSEGATATTYNLRPKYLDGLSGVVKDIVRNHSKPYATVVLDKASTAELSLSSSKYHHLSGRDSYDLAGIPLSCLKITNG